MGIKKSVRREEASMIEIGIGIVAGIIIITILVLTGVRL